MPAEFSHQNGSVIFRSAPPLSELPLDVVQPQRKTATGKAFGFVHTITSEPLPLRLRMTTSEKDQLLVFFYTIVNGKAELFSYIDSRGDVFQVRFEKSVLEGLIEKAANVWELAVTLRKFANNWVWPSGDTMLWPNGDIMGI
jgi:hypothetical protein